jgi:adenylate kinase family enzyme
MKRCLVLGAGGAGKTTLALELGRVLDLPVIHLDRHYWRPGWVEPSHAEFDETVVRLVSGPAWIMDGNYSRTLDLRLPRADTVILLDPPTLQCLLGVMRRGLFRRARIRPDLAEGCEEQLPDLQFLRYVATYKRRSRPKVLRQIREASHVRFFHLRSRREAARFVGELAGASTVT